LSLSTLVLAETERNLAKKAPIGLAAFETFKSALVADSVDPPKELVVSVAQVIEIKDAPIVAGAIEARADYLASFDRRHLLSQAELIRARFEIIVATPDEVIGSLA
ncbi:MAG: hypothetical protein M3442_16860, partial [Chloroflexota bacterium]|nr:hypothetical protein [Chloroflexota bacterium]